MEPHDPSLSGSIVTKSRLKLEILAMSAEAVHANFVHVPSDFVVVDCHESMSLIANAKLTGSPPYM